MGGSQALFSVATAAIPGLLFAGAITGDKVDNNSGRPKLSALVLLFVFGALVGELFAIRGAIDPNLSELEIRYIVGVLTVGTSFIAFLTAGPWLNDLPERLRVTPVAIVGLTITVVAAQVGISGALEAFQHQRALSQAKERLAHASGRVKVATQSLNGAHYALESVLSGLSAPIQRDLSRPILLFVDRTKLRPYVIRAPPKRALPAPAQEPVPAPRRPHTSLEPGTAIAKRDFVGNRPRGVALGITPLFVLGGTPAPPPPPRVSQLGRALKSLGSALANEPSLSELDQHRLIDKARDVIHAARELNAAVAVQQSAAFAYARSL